MSDPNHSIHWKRLDRTTIVDTPFIKLFSDTIELPSGHVIDDYTVVSLPDGVVIVATDEQGRLITQFEYKYAIDRTILNLPSGGALKGESILEVAAKELREETGYVSDDLVLVQSLSEYPSKQTHAIHIVRARNARKLEETSHEVTEAIGPVNLLSANMDDFGGVFDATYTVAALAITLPEFLKR